MTGATTRTARGWMWASLPAAAACGAVGVFAGSEPIPLADVWAALAAGPTPWTAPDAAGAIDRIVWQLRLPRVVLALVAGGGLSVVGVAMQALVRNPLAEPYILGISSGAAAGASLFYLGMLPPLLGTSLSLSSAAFVGGLATISVVFSVARSGSRVPVARLLLAGVAMSALMSALTSLILYLSPNADVLRAVIFWLLGSLGGASWSTIGLPVVVSIAGGLFIWVRSRALDALLLGEEPARSLGFAPEPLKLSLIVVSALVTGVLVAACGAVGFVGLIVPHAVRSLIGVRHARVVPVSFAAGACFLTLADVAGRVLIRPAELPVGVITALCGVPFFLVLLRRSSYRFG